VYRFQSYILLLHIIILNSWLINLVGPTEPTDGTEHFMRFFLLIALNVAGFEHISRFGSFIVFNFVIKQVVTKCVKIVLCAQMNIHLSTHHSIVVHGR